MVTFRITFPTDDPQNALYVALPSYVVIMGGGAIVNLGFCFIRLATCKGISLKADLAQAKPLLIANALFAILGGVMWYLQFFFYAWGHANIPADYTYISWMLHMSFYVLCGGIVGLLFKEWKAVGQKPGTYAGSRLRGHYSGSEYRRVRDGRVSALSSRSVSSKRVPNAITIASINWRKNTLSR